MKPTRGVTLAAVCARTVPAGIIASSSGSPSAAPRPRSTVRRGRCFLGTNISVAPGADLKVGGYGDGGYAGGGYGDGGCGCGGYGGCCGGTLDDSRAERRRVHDAQHDGRELVLRALCVEHDRADAGHVVRVEAAAE